MKLPKIDWSWTERVFLWPLFGGVTTVVGVIAGLLGAHYDKDVFEATLWIPWRSPANMFAPGPTLFLSFTIAFGYFFSGTLKAQSKSANRARAELNQQAAHLEDLVRRLESLPPEDFLANYQTALRSATNSLVGAFGEFGNIEPIEKAIRNILGAVLELVGKYDRSSDSATYSANIMLFRASEATEQATLVYATDTTPLHPDHDGCLELVTTLSTTTKTAEFGPDVSVPPLCLPLPKDKQATRDKMLNARYSVMPGAPWAYVHKEFVGFPTIQMLDEWLDTTSSLDTKTMEDLRLYFKTGEGRNIHSFISMPLLDVGNKELAVGVLNLHSDRTGLLEEKGAERFSPLLEPFRLLLSILIAVREQARLSKQPKTGENITK